MCNVQMGRESMGGNMSRVEKRREGICPDGKTTGGNMSGVSKMTGVNLSVSHVEIYSRQSHKSIFCFKNLTITSCI